MEFDRHNEAILDALENHLLLFCDSCGHVDMVRALFITPDGMLHFGSDADHCTKCGDLWGG